MDYEQVKIVLTMETKFKEEVGQNLEGKEKEKTRAHIHRREGTRGK